MKRTLKLKRTPKKKMTPELKTTSKLKTNLNATMKMIVFLYEVFMSYRDPHSTARWKCSMTRVIR